MPFSEDDVTDTPASLYAATKKADELLAHTYNHIHGVAITALRFFTVYGAFGRPDMAYFSFANQIAKGEPIKIFQGEDDAGGAKELARDFTFIGDVVSGIIASLETSEASGKKPDGAKPKFRVYNLGNKTPVTVSEFVGVLEKHLGKKRFASTSRCRKPGTCRSRTRTSRARAGSSGTSRRRRWTTV